MLFEKSAGAIIFRRKDNQIYYLVLQYPTNKTGSKKEYWGFAKGGIEGKETITETARREIKEETGLKDIKLIKQFKEKEKYFFTVKKEKIFKIVIYLLAETNQKEIKISHEHVSWQWLPYQQALKKLTFKNARQVLKKANVFIVNKKPL
jgi:bis(5'-nucleosidyl)-tetraphosphatase